ncbi:MAG: tetraacyldisaccharide 4'-kinase [Tannerellaceae bacterium]|nr:tetraacyldisaccharide 4'-kinase [Tannerellaceae bacterium]
MHTDSPIKFNYWLAPVAFLYGIGVRFRNFLFNKDILEGKQFPVPVISIGNLAVGGTGKTPHTEYIIRLIKDKYKVAVLSRGYKRKTKGFILADDKSSSKTLGDEPYQMHLKFPEILVAVDEDKRHGIQYLLDLPAEQKPEVILLDDAFQHRYVTPSLSIVLSDYNRLFYYDQLLPVGRLREPKEGIRRADIVIVSKCIDELKPIDCRIIEADANLLAHQNIFFTQIIYGKMLPVFPEYTETDTPALDKADRLLVVTGIAHPELFIEKAKKYTDNVTSLTFSDHHDFTQKDIKKMQAFFSASDATGKSYILTTEKDAVRLKDNPHIPEEWKGAVFYLPIEIDFHIKNDLSFDEIITKHIKTFRNNSI